MSKHSFRKVKAALLQPVSEQAIISWSCDTGHTRDFPRTESCGFGLPNQDFAGHIAALFHGRNGKSRNVNLVFLLKNATFVGIFIKYTITYSHAVEDALADRWPVETEPGVE